MATALTPVWAAAQDLPTGGSVVHGNATIATPNANTMVINQGSDRAVVNWDDFSVGAGNRVDINQPNADSAILNRVTGDTTSQIHGQINANGRVFVVNPNGIFIGETGSVNTGSFVASTLGIRTEDFATGQLVFDGDGSSATVSNAGNIQVVTGGYAALIGGKVKNSGTIQAPLGFVGLGSGERITLDLAGDGFLQVAIPTDTDDDGLEALIENSGTIQANGGTVQISAATARNAARQAINMSGVIEARSVSGRNGRVTLGGGAGGAVKVTGKVRTTSRPAIQVTQSARPAARPERGGDITITGREITLEGAEIDASGTNGGGSIRIGGNMRGAPGLMTATTLNGDTATIITADALSNGNGGRVILWSDVRTEFAGRISATGGNDSGDGGFVEVSGKEVLSYSGQVDTRAANGDWGTLLLDPQDIFIVDVLTQANGEILASDIESNLALNGQVEVQTTSSSSGNGLGNIVVEAPLNWTSDSELILEADNSIRIDAPIVAPNGQLTLFTFSDTPVTTGANGDINVGTFYLADGNWEQVGGNLPSFTAQNFFIEADSFLFDDGDGIIPIPGSEFLRATGGLGTLSNPYEITDVFGLQGIGTLNSGGDDYVLVNDINASGTENWFEPVSGFDQGSGGPNRGFRPMALNGSLDGAGHIISGLFSERFSSFEPSDAGLFSSIGSGASVTDLTIQGADISGYTVGILAAENDGLIQGVSVSGDVTTFIGFDTSEGAGGIVGSNGSGSILDSVAAVNIQDAFDPESDGEFDQSSLAIGGIAGVNDGVIARTNTSGSLQLDDALVGYVGGIAGINDNEITDSYSVAAVNGTGTSGTTMNVGGITGGNFGTLENVLANGAVSQTGDGSVGGITGMDSETSQSIISSFFNSETTGQSLSGQLGEDTTGTFGSGPFEGGLAQTTQQLNDALAFLDIAETAGWDFANVWSFPQDGSDFSRLLSTSPVISARVLSDAGTSEIPEFEYTGLTTDLELEGEYFGGPEVYLFGPLNDSGDLSELDAQIELSEPDVGERDLVFPDSYISVLGQVFEVRTLSQASLVTPAPLTITADNQNKPFGTEFTFEGTEFTVEGLLNTDTFDSATLSSLAAAADAPFTGDEGVAILISEPTGVGLENYEITLVDGIMIIAPGNLTITALDQTKVYGTTFTFDGTEFAVEGLAEGDSVDSVTLTSAAAIGTAQVADGPFSIIASDAVGTGLDRYTLIFADGSFAVTPAPLSVSALDQTKQQGQLFTFAGTEFVASGLLNDDTVTTVALFSNGAAANALADDSPFDILVGEISGTGLSNYEITLVDGIMNIAPGNLTITALDQTKVYGTTFTFDGTEFAVEGLAEGDSVDSVTLTSAAAIGTAQVADGPFSIIASDAVGTGLDRYTLIFADGSFAVTPAPLSVSALDQTKQQGQLFTFAGTEFAASGLLNVDTVTTVALFSNGAAADALADDSPFDILVGEVSGTGLSNYEVSTANGVFTVQNLIAPPVINPVPGGNRSIQNPRDNITIAFPGDNVGTASLGSTQSRGGGTGGPTQTLRQAEQTQEVVSEISTDLEQQVQSCGSSDQDFTNYMACLSASLDTYANALDQIAIDLPSGLETVSATIRTARDGVNAATARASRRLAGATSDAERNAIRRDAVNEARGAIQEAKSEIRKAIGLIRADDPEVAAVQRDTGARIIQAFDTVESSLVRAVEL